MKNTHTCPKCGSSQIARIPDNGRYANGNNIYLNSTFALIGRIPLIRYVCCQCGFAEQWIESGEGLEKLRKEYL